MPTSPTCRTTRKSGAQYERKASDIISLQQQIAGDIADRLRSKLSGTESQQVTEQGTQNPEAYQLYVRGRYYWNMRTNADIKTAISYFNQAIDKDPGYALAYSGIADADGVLINYGSDRNDVTPKASAAAEKALELDPARPHAVLGYNKMLYDWNFPAARPSSKGPSTSIPATPPPTSGSPRLPPTSVAGCRSRLMKAIGPVSLIRYRRS